MTWLEADDTCTRVVVSGVGGADRGHAWLAGIEDLPVSEIGFVAFMADVADEVRPWDTVGSAD